ncbi:hypothetical protein DL763_008010 [Monosporascus cannonballus]|nr:hypothetical protein DL763_008010 [Monosporascus cannonballus]
MRRLSSHTAFRYRQSSTKALALASAAVGNPSQVSLMRRTRSAGERVSNARPKLKAAVKHAQREGKAQVPQSASALFVEGLAMGPQANSVTTGYSLKRSTLLDTRSDFHVGNRKTDFVDLHPPTASGRLLAGGKYLGIVGEGTRRITLTTLMLEAPTGGLRDAGG